ncbi:putative GST-like protein YibF [Variibacter gotjawalensis]|uniref:Putative GST-like protein YibF n=1 Tax=Variibacter gotjawalensis TaxID=1333996 RepID=A0A0S3PY61_9BRAD|nr:glutathione S-transferase family protein [Variibacter gotjawalensis]NIK46725.1 glutathione S-transferase [Variibacter gotjawalensis]RZS48628.1 glutathione S-transferase [Variibacter gotjawalensis]BAT60890.1 putative GST-like protein YibF [Variibacter gotjawalensis]
MILIGQYDSPFVRRVGIAMTLYSLTFEHKAWSTFGDADKIRPYNPLTRVPTLVLDDGDVLVESHLIIDYLDGLVAADKRLYPTTEPARHRALKAAATAMHAADKAVALFYEKALHKEVSEVWSSRCQRQIEAALTMLNAERARQTTAFWFGEAIGHADIAVAVAVRFIRDAHPKIDISPYPALIAFADACESRPEFQAISQVFIAPA